MTPADIATLNGRTITEVARFRDGDLCRFHEPRTILRDGVQVVLEMDLGLYRICVFALDAHTRRDLVVYVGLEGADRERYFVCSLPDFACHFRRELTEAPAPVAVAEAIPEKVAGFKSTSMFG